MKPFQTVADVADWRLCLGCGACAFICPERKIQIVDLVDEGMRPAVASSACRDCRECLEVCPAWRNDHLALATRPGLMRELLSSFGPVLEIWEGHATDPEVRRQGASGGILTALSVFALERESLHGVLHIGADPFDPTRNRTMFSRTADDLLSRSGSRYAAACACDSLQRIADAPAPCVFVGQPSEVTALRKAQRRRPDLDRNVALALSFFCAGSPSRAGTLKLLASLNVAAAETREVRYRGNGWPGNFAVTLKGETTPSRQMSYAESWAFVQAYRPFSTHLCPDGTGEDADISCGDPWYRAIAPGEAGSSLVVVRTEAGRDFLRRAREARAIALTPAEPWKLLRSQKNLLAKRGAVGGRIAALRLLGLPVPRLRGFFLFAHWLRLPWREQLRSVFGTFRRVAVRGYYRPRRVPPAGRVSAPPTAAAATPR